jgi:hypothetical protein
MQPPLPPPPPPAPLPAYGPTPPYGYPPQYGNAVPAKRSRRRWWIFGCGGCGAIALIAVIVIVVVGVHIFTNSPLRQFPTEAGSSTVSDTFGFANGHSSEILVIDDPNSLTDAETYYQGALNTNGWTVQAADPTQAASGDRWQFIRTGTSGQSGVIGFVTIGAVTQITAEYVS